MKVIYNDEYGGFSWPEEIVEEFGLKGWRDVTRANRTNPEIVSRIEQIIQPYIERKRQYDRQREQLIGDQWFEVDREFHNWCKNNMNTDLRVAVIPDDVTDWMVSDYDGLETIYFVRNGKIYCYSEDGLGEPVNKEE